MRTNANRVMIEVVSELSGFDMFWISPNDICEGGSDCKLHNSKEYYPGNDGRELVVIVAEVIGQTGKEYFFNKIPEQDSE